MLNERKIQTNGFMKAGVGAFLFIIYNQYLEIGRGKFIFS